MLNKEQMLDKLCLPILDEIYCVQGEHRLLFADLVESGVCYLNKDMLAFDIIHSILEAKDFVFGEPCLDDKFFNKHKNIIRASKPTICEGGWIRVSRKI